MAYEEKAELKAERLKRSDSTVSPALFVDFSKYNRDLIAEGLHRLLSVFYNKCVLRQVVVALLRQVQEVYSAAIEVERLRTLYYAEGVNLEALGRIVGQERRVVSYDESNWLLFDVQGNGFDQMPFWVEGGYLNSKQYAPDPKYRELILAKIIKNHTLVASVPEIINIVKAMYNLDISFEKTGPNKVRVILQDTASRSQIYNVIHKENTLAVDSDYLISYPATLELEDKVWFIRKDGFYFDRESPFQWDVALWSLIA